MERLVDKHAKSASVAIAPQDLGIDLMKIPQILKESIVAPGMSRLGNAAFNATAGVIQMLGLGPIQALNHEPPVRDRADQAVRFE
jgi:hypothetical protein